jgi:hypothetical protein
MTPARQFPVYGDNGKIGVVVAPARFLDDRPEKLVRFDDGSEEMVPSDALQPQPDGSFYLRRRTEPNVPPEPESQAETSEPAPPPADEEFYRLGFNVRRVTVNRVIDEPAKPRQEGDTMIYPVMEEVLVVQKKLVLKEEIYVTPERTPIAARRFELDDRH